MTVKYMRTSDLARAVGIHPNTVRRYVDWGLIPPVERSPAGYRLFSQRHLDCLRLVRLLFSADYPGRKLRALGREIIECAVDDDWQAAQAKAHTYRDMVIVELDIANQAADLLENWAQSRARKSSQKPLSIRDVTKLLGVSNDVIRNWERNGLIKIPRNPYNNYRLFGQNEIDRMRIIHVLSKAGYSHMAMLRMFIEFDRGNIRNLKKALDTPREFDDVYMASDRWLSTLKAQEILAGKVTRLIEEKILLGETRA
jgi:DNA-binding transcriptional MerR regulator